MTDGRFRALIAASLALPVVMAFLSPTDCDGVWCLCTFDAQFLPYAPQAARHYLAAIGDDRLRYLSIVQPLDLILPLTICLALREGFTRWASARVAGWLRRAALIYLVLDYAENAAIHVMLRHPDGAFPNWIALAASGLTTLKWALLLPVLLLAMLMWLRRRFDRQGAAR